MNLPKPIDVTTLHANYAYNPDTGVFIHLRKGRAGQPAGCRLANGYLHIGLNRGQFLAHRLAWAYVHGPFEGLIDHIDGNPSNNRLANLRLSTQQQNKQNSRIRRDASSGFKGVVFQGDVYRSRPWKAYIGPRGAVRILGYFATKEEAAEAYRKAAAETYGEFARA